MRTWLFVILLVGGTLAARPLPLSQETDDAPQLAESSLHRFSGAFEWWYFDVETTAGLKAVFVFSRRNKIISRAPALYVELTDGSRTLKKVYPYSEEDWSYSETESGKEMRLGPHRVEIARTKTGKKEYRLLLHTADFQADLVFTPQTRGFKPSEDGCYFVAKKDPRFKTCVSFSGPFSTVRGQLDFGGHTAAVDGMGYHDHPWGTADLFATHREWHWARLFSGSEALLFAEVAPSKHYSGKLVFAHYLNFRTGKAVTTDQVEITPARWTRHSLLAHFPQELTFFSPEIGKWSTRYRGMLLDYPFYVRSAVDYRSSTGESGTGWAEYYTLGQGLSSFARLGAKLSYLFWR